MWEKRLCQNQHEASIVQKFVEWMQQRREEKEKDSLTINDAKGNYVGHAKTLTGMIAVGLVKKQNPLRVGLLKLQKLKMRARLPIHTGLQNALIISKGGYVDYVFTVT